MAIVVKPGVIFAPCHPAGGMRILEVLKTIAPGLDFDICITSATDGVHSGPDDPHHKGNAFDLRTHGLTPAQKGVLLDLLQKNLYKNPRKFYAFLESPGTGNEHIHVQVRNGVVYTFDDYLKSA